MPILCLKYRLYPTKAQATKMKTTLETCREVYNSMLNSRKHDYQVHGKSPSHYEQIKELPKWKKEHPELLAVHSQVLQNVSVRVDLAFKAFFRRVKAGGEKPGFPRFKGDGYDSFTYPQTGWKVMENCVTLTKIGTVKAKIHRPIVGKIKTCTVLRTGDKWFVCFACEVEHQPLPISTEAVGIDVGLEKFAALSDGSFIENPRFFRVEEKALAKVQRKLSKCIRGSRERRRAKKAVRRVHERIRNRRHNFVHQNARQVVNKFGTIAVEKLNTKSMLQNSHLSKSISDASWSMFRAVLSQKAESAARKFVEVNPAYTSQDCSRCGYRAKKPLKERWHFCPICSLSLDRDTNAAINILGLGLQSLAG